MKFDIAKIFNTELFQQDENAWHNSPLLNHIRGKKVLFIGGLMNELANLISSYFYDSQNLLKFHQISHHYIGTNSMRSYIDDANMLHAQIRAYHDKNPVPIILVGHSKGGAAALLTILQNPYLLLNKIVDKVILISAAIGGTELAKNLPGYITGPALKFGFKESLKSCTHEESKQIFDTALKTLTQRLTLSQIQILNDNIYYIRMATPHSLDTNGAQHGPLSLELRLARWFSDSKVLDHIPNDGILPLSSQILEGIGNDLGILRSDHNSLVISSRTGHATTRERKAFTRAIFECVYPEYSKYRKKYKIKKQLWMRDLPICQICTQHFNFMSYKYNCYRCGKLICSNCIIPVNDNQHKCRFGHP